MTTVAPVAVRGRATSAERFRAAERLEPGEQVTCTATYVTTGAGVGRGGLTNTAVAQGFELRGTEITTSFPYTVSVAVQSGLAPPPLPATGTDHLAMLRVATMVAAAGLARARTTRRRCERQAR